MLDSHSGVAAQEVGWVIYFVRCSANHSLTSPVCCWSVLGQKKTKPHIASDSCFVCVCMCVYGFRVVHTLQRRHLPLVSKCVCKWMNADLLCKVLWVVEGFEKCCIKAVHLPSIHSNGSTQEKYKELKTSQRYRGWGRVVGHTQDFQPQPQFESKGKQKSVFFSQLKPNQTLIVSDH